MRAIERHTAGMALITVVILIGFLGLALAAAGAAFASSARVTRAAGEDAQVRQLLLAGERAVRQALPAGEAPGDLALPDALASRDASVRITRAVDAESTFRIEARIGQRSAAQVVRYARDGDAWRLAEAKLE